MKKLIIVGLFLGVVFAGDIDRTIIYNKDGVKLIQEVTKPEPNIVIKEVIVEKVITQTVIVKDTKDIDELKAKNEDLQIKVNQVRDIVGDKAQCQPLIPLGIGFIIGALIL